MGEMYRARDTSLARDVAIKVLPTAFRRDPERLARFQWEAEVLASLDHPNIGHIRGIIKTEDSRALVLAPIEGSTLRQALWMCCNFEELAELGRRTCSYRDLR